MRNINAVIDGTAPQVDKSAGRSLLIRVLSASVLIPVAVACVVFGGMFFFTLVALFAAVMTLEWDRLTGGKGPGVWVSVVAVLAILLVLHVSSALNAGIVFAVGFVLVTVAGMVGRRVIVWPLAGYVYVTLPAVSLLWLRGAPDDGLVLVTWLFVVVWSTDIGAYAFGRSIGGPKLAPKTSPNKTWAGLIGGALTAAVIGTAVVWALDGGYALLLVALGGVLFAVLAQISDLVESAVKRHFHVKDSGSIIPGHGGVLDRVDGIILTAPALVILVILMNETTIVWH